VANYWMHNGYINIDNEKMSKSLDNFILVNDIRKKVDPKVLRFFILSVHYRHPVNFSEELVNQAKAGLERITTAYQNIQYRLASSADLGDQSDVWLHKIASVKEAFITAMDDDFNTANGIAAIFELTRLAIVYLQWKFIGSILFVSFSEKFDELIDFLVIAIADETALLVEDIERLIAERLKARKNRDFQRAYAIVGVVKEKS